MARKPVEGGTQVIATMTQKNNANFPIAYASSIDLDDGTNLQEALEQLQAGEGNEIISNDEIDGIFN